ncbi:MAG: ATP-binding protein, partial [Cyanobacteria bacterium P01_F01_bin.53]
PEIKIRTEMIAGDSSGAEHKPRVRITIANTGYPIAPEIQDKIFEPFFTTKSVGQGAGLGLFVSYSIVQQHEGDLTVRSQAGGTTEFVITLPT